MINIGPWWLFDIMAFAIIIGCTIWGMTRGFLITFYLLILQIIVVILLMFVPALLANSMNPLFMKLWVSIGMDDAFSYFGESIGNLITGLLPNGSSLPMDGSGTGYEVLKTLSALGLYFLFSILIFILVNLIGLLLYKTFKRKMRKMKVIRKVDTLIGAFNGLALGMTLSMSVSFLASFPLFQTENQRIGLMDYSGLTEEQVKDKILGGTAYSKYSLSKKITAPLPSVPVFGFTYTNSCLTKYVIDPVMVMTSQMLANKGMADLKDFFVVYEDVLAEGYSTTNPFSSPISACIDVMPRDSKSLFRLFSEMMLMGSSIFINNNVQTKTNVTSVELINSLDEYFLNNLGTESELHKEGNTWLNQKEMVNFYNWTKENKKENPFVKVADNIDKQWLAAGKKNQRYISKVLRDPKLTYNFLKSINYVNATSRTNLDTMPFLSAIYTSTYLIDGMEIVPSGELKLGEFEGITLTPSTKVGTNKNDVSKIVVQPEWWKEHYKNTYWIQYYFDFAKGYFN
ncbi:hypothetical protein [Spiroplasma sp. BIUS-1]|uniref:hypothetical protein n=1 Tax=Spiroplasma sp. BIUS-1 TaxID=216964 RepID=UPI0013989A7B|nr:hypothetical protein [Spiroplasma sp. BIUS-1]QHX36841.1 CvpA family protein [Spiroplasma sp. BIUS-1]